MFIHQMEYIQIYKCLCDKLRLRILNLLKEGPLCVCHLVELLNTDQVKVSKQLRYMKDLGIVDSERHAQWMIYRLIDSSDPLLIENLKCLQDCYSEHISFSEDLKKRRMLARRIQRETPSCAEAINDQETGFDA